MIPLQYAYLIFSALSLIPWIIIFFYRKDLRNEMLSMSLIVTVFGVIWQYLYWTHDWWSPQTILSTRVSIEDILLGIGNGGVISVIYTVLFRRKNIKISSRSNNTGAIMLMLLGLSVFFIAYYVLKLPSAVGTNI